jgi:hypothetical protein
MTMNEQFKEAELLLWYAKQALYQKSNLDVTIGHQFAPIKVKSYKLAERIEEFLERGIKKYEQ